MEKEKESSHDFIREIIDNDLKTNKTKFETLVKEQCEQIIKDKKY